jgi:KaiC/GvpD/RAD55 family RecA-like ATPase
MSIEITIPGLTEFITEIPEGNLILVEGSIDPIATIFVQYMAISAIKNGKEIQYITSRTEEEVREKISYFYEPEIKIN